MLRKPRGYVGLNHETRGGDIVAILKTLHTPQLTLGADLYARLSQVKEEEWYPIGTLLEMHELLETKMGAYGLRQVGWHIFATYHAAEARKHFNSARGLLHALDAMYHQGNRGHQIGGWKVSVFEPGYAEMEKTTPHHCAMEEGIVEEALRTMGASSQVDQIECFRKGAPLCRFRIRSKVVDQRWNG